MGIAVLAGLRPGLAQSYEIVHTFGQVGGGPSGDLALLADGSLLGANSGGGLVTQGAVFRLKPDGQGGYTYDELHSFFEPEGSTPLGGLTADGTGFFYGTTQFGGKNHNGTVFQVDGSGRHTLLHTFDRLADGALPLGPLIQALDGSFWGTTSIGGEFDNGTVFRIDRLGTLTTVHSFSGGDGAYPHGRLLQAADGNIYGTTYVGGSGDKGTVFRIDALGVLTILHSFSGADGFLIDAGLAQGDDQKLYGTTNFGGADDDGVVYRIDPSGANFEVIHEFSLASDGQQPLVTLIRAAAGGFSGATATGGAGGAGTVFHLDPTGTVTPLHQFNFLGGGATPVALVEGPGGILYGSTAGGGAFGTVFRLDTNGTLTTLTGFDQKTPVVPNGGLTEGTDGKLYGTTSYAVSNGGGSVYAVEAQGSFSVLHYMSASEGSNLQGSLLLASDGALYGMALDGGTNDNGTLFKITTAGVFSTLHAFSNSEPGNPWGGFADGGDGFLYGAENGGDSSLGEIFKINEQGELTTVHAFAGPDGSYPLAPPVRASGGNLYGTAGGGGQAGAGTLYRVDPLGVFTSIHDFVGMDGGPPGPILAASDGNLYGASRGGGPSGAGVVFKLDAAEVVSTLHNFQELTDGQTPVSLAQGGDTHLYGTTANGGTAGQGTIFRLDLDGTFSVLHHFQGPEGKVPYGTPLLASDGYLYGTTVFGGAANSGVIFRIVFTPTPPVLNDLLPSSGRAAGGTTVTIRGNHFSLNPTVAFAGSVSTVAAEPDCFHVLSIAPDLSPGTLNDVVVTNADATTAALVGGWFADFLDVDSVHSFHDFVESIFRAGITAGCLPGYYCPDQSVTREQMAVFLLKAKHGSAYAPPACTGVFADVTCTPDIGFPDWIERLYAEEVTGGCFTDPLRYCPDRSVTRAEMAVFLLKTEHGSGYAPPACAGIFDDVPCPATVEFPYSDWIERLYGENVTGGCFTGPLRYCPDAPNTRGEMAVFLTKTFSLP